MKKLAIVPALALGAMLLLASCSESPNQSGTQSPAPSQGPSQAADPTPDPTPDETPIVTPDETPANPSETTLDGNAETVLTSLINDSGLEFGMAGFDSLTAENIEFGIGLAPELLGAQIIEGYVHQPMISSSAYITAVLVCESDEAAAEVAQSLKDFDVTRWVCVFPEECFTMQSGKYVFFGATTADYGSTLREMFQEAAGGNAVEDLFYTN